MKRLFYVFVLCSIALVAVVVSAQPQASQTSSVQPLVSNNFATQNLLNQTLAGSAHKASSRRQLRMLVDDSIFSTALDPTSPVKSIIEKMRAEVNKVIDKALNAGNALVVAAGTQVLLSLEAFEQSADKLLGSAFGKLNNSQRLFFTNIQVAMLQVDGWVNATLDRGEELVGGITSLLSYSFGGGRPIITRYSPRTVIPMDSAAGPVIFRFNGTAMKTGNVTLKINGKTYVKQADTDLQVSFAIPRSEFVHDPTKLTAVQAELTLKRRQLGIFIDKGIRIFKLVDVVYHPLLIVLPEKFASARLLTFDQVDQVREEVRTQFIGFNAKSECRDYPFQVMNPENKLGVPVLDSVSSSGGPNPEFLNVTEKGFVLHLCTDTRSDWLRKYDGWKHVNLRYSEFYPYKIDTTAEKTFEYKWNMEDVYTLKYQRFVLEVTTFDGVTNKCNGTCERSYFRVVEDAPRQQILFLPTKFTF
jgi:hypothetical protein